MEITNEQFERATLLAFKNGYVAGYEQAINDTKTAFDSFAITAIKNAETYQMPNTQVEEVE